MSARSVSTEELIDLLQSSGVKPSVQRLSVLRYVMEKMNHPSVDKIYQSLLPQIPTLSKTTVYNTLNQLTEKGIITALNIDDTEIKYDFIEHTHAHFICTSCGQIYDIELNSDICKMQSVEGHQVINAQVNFKGICNNCKHKSKEN